MKKIMQQAGAALLSALFLLSTFAPVVRAADGEQIGEDARAPGEVSA